MGAPTKPWLGLTGRPGSTGRAGGAIEVGLDGADPRRPPGRTIPLQSRPDNSQKESPGEAGVGRWLWSRYSLFWLQRALREQRAPHLVHLEAWSPPKSGRHPQQIPKSGHPPLFFFLPLGSALHVVPPSPLLQEAWKPGIPGILPSLQAPHQHHGINPCPTQPLASQTFPKIPDLSPSHTAAPLSIPPQLLSFTSHHPLTQNSSFSSFIPCIPWSGEPKPTPPGQSSWSIVANSCLGMLGKSAGSDSTLREVNADD